MECKQALENEICLAQTVMISQQSHFFIFEIFCFSPSDMDKPVQERPIQWKEREVMTPVYPGKKTHWLVSYLEQCFISLRDFRDR